jgi:hypothetical protein
MSTAILLTDTIDSTSDHALCFDALTTRRIYRNRATASMGKIRDYRFLRAVWLTAPSISKGSQAMRRIPDSVRMRQYVQWKGRASNLAAA